MDFDCLTRKELQFLCKRNKIPANITNVAMADALKALEIVEGLDEFRNQSPEKTMTSTRRKPSKEELQATQSTIGTRKTSRKLPETPAAATNTSRRIPKAQLEIKDETPSQSCRGRTGVESRRKVETQTGYATRRSVRLLGKSMSGLSLKENEKEEPVKDDEMVESEVGNNNGQSGDTSELPLVRNLCSSLEDEREKNDDVEEKSECDNEKNVENLKPVADESDDVAVSDAIAVSEDSFENLKPVADETDDVAVSDASSLEDEREKNDDVEEKSECDNEKNVENLKPVADESDDVAVSDAIAVSEDSFENLKPVADETDDVAVSDAIAVSEDTYAIDNLKPVADETDDVAVSDAIAVSEDTYAAENLKPVADETDDVAVSDAIAVSEDTYEIENLKPVADETDDIAVPQEGYEIENLEEEMVVEKSIEVLVANAEEPADMKAIDAVTVEEDANQAPQEIESKKSLGEDCEFNAVHDDLTQLPKTEEYSDNQVSQNVSVFPEGHMDSSAEKQNEESDDDDDDEDSFPSDSDFDDDTGSDSQSLADSQEEVSFKQKSIPTAAYSSEGPMTIVIEEALVDDDEDDTENEESDDDDDALVDDDDDDTGMEESDDDDALVDDYEDETGIEESDDDAFVDVGDLDMDNEDPMANVVYEEALVDANVTEVGTIPVSSFHNTSQSVVYNGDSDALINVCVKQAEGFAETAVANSEITITSNSSISSPLKAQLSEPRQSSSKKETTIPEEVTQVLENINKENIDNQSVKKELDLGLKKVKKNKNLEELSIRNLKKMIKQLNKLEIADKNKEDDTLNKVPALQTLSQNSMKSEETEKLD